jgi:NAD(P)H-nitrite reductase large subunit
MRVWRHSQDRCVRLHQKRSYLAKGDKVNTRKQRYVIIGGGPAGFSSAQVIRHLDPEGSITILSEEPHMPYFRPMIPYLISGEKMPSDIMFEIGGSFKEGAVNIRINTRVVDIDTDAQVVLLSEGEKVPYDKLLIASGSRAILPEGISGVEAEGVFTMRTINDAISVSAWSKQVREAVMLGGGLVSLKTASALVERGVKVTIVEQEPEILPRIMEPDGGSFIRHALERVDIEVLTECRIIRILTQENRVKGVLLADGGEIPCQMVCVGVGVRPNVEFLEQTSIMVDQGVVVDRFTRCNVPNVYAAGDVAETINPVTGTRLISALWTNAIEMGRCAGYNMAGKTMEYNGAFNVLNATQVADLPFIAVGLIHTSGTEYEVHIHKTKDTYRKLIFSPDGTRLVGALFIGDIARAGLYRYLIREGVPIQEIKSLIINHRLHYGHILKRP